MNYPLWNYYETPQHHQELVGRARTLIPFLACGDLSAWDSDMSYPLQLGDQPYEYREPVQKPIDPPYKTAIELKQRNLLNI
jgi:tRNA (cytidine32/guanosine34-2'-O)-methyltransferase